MVSGKALSSGFSAEKIQVKRLRGSIGRGILARLANWAARGPAALIKWPQDIFSPVASVIASTVSLAALR